MITVRGIHWRDSAACTTDETQAAFGDDWDEDEAEDLAAAKEFAATICSRCPVIVECLEYAERYQIRFGVFGGMTAEARGWVNEPAD